MKTFDDAWFFEDSSDSDGAAAEWAARSGIVRYVARSTPDSGIGIRALLEYPEAASGALWQDATTVRRLPTRSRRRAPRRAA